MNKKRSARKNNRKILEHNRLKPRLKPRNKFKSCMVLTRQYIVGQATDRFPRLLRIHCD